MGRVAWVWAAAAAAAVSGCGDARNTEAAAAGGERGCASCHSAPGEAPPFRDQTGSTDPSRITVGAHDKHLHPNITAPIDCSECHTKPRSVADPGHLDHSPGDMHFGTIATTGGVSPTYVQPTCTAVYCHGNFPGGNTGNTVSWIGGPANQAACGTCHDLPPQTGLHAFHITKTFQGEPITCGSCHGPFDAVTHVNGVKTLAALTSWDPQQGNCTAVCHTGPRSWR